MDKGKIAGPLDGNLERTMAACSSCQVRRKKSNMHAVLERGGDAVIAWLCARCAPTGE